MRFNRMPRYEFKRARLKELAAERKLRKQRGSMPLLTELIAAAQPTVDEVMASRERAWMETERAWRARRARQWREARKRYFSLSHHLRRVLQEVWRQGGYPGDPLYLSYVVKKAERGEV